MKQKLVIFDMDDVLWNLNNKAARMAGIEVERLIMFSAHKNPLLTDDMRERLLAAYASRKLYEDIIFSPLMVNLVNKIHRDYSEYRVMISSNCMAEYVRDIKLAQLKEVLDIPEENICLNLIDMTTQSTQKILPPDIYLFVDDSPHNIAMADALHKVMPARNWNDPVNNPEVIGHDYDRPVGDRELCNTIMKYIRSGME